MAKLDPIVEARIARAPFIEITDGHYKDLLVDYRRVISVRGPGPLPIYARERGRNAVIVVDGIRIPIGVDDEVGFILALINAAAGKAPVPFITLTFGDDTVIHVDARRIVAVKEDTTDDDRDTCVYVDGYRNEGDEGSHWSVIVKNSVDEIIDMIRKA